LTDKKLDIDTRVSY